MSAPKQRENSIRVTAAGVALLLDYHRRTCNECHGGTPCDEAISLRTALDLQIQKERWKPPVVHPPAPGLECTYTNPECAEKHKHPLCDIDIKNCEECAAYTLTRREEASSK